MVTASRSNYLRSWVVVAIALITVGWVALVAVSGRAVSAGADTTKVVIERVDGSTTSPFHLEVVSNETQRQRGLMYRKELAPDAGMLFIFPDEAVRSFWMKNTYVSLDLLFIDAKWRVVGVRGNTVPLSTDSVSVTAPAKYVIELVAGAANTHKVTVGALVRPQGPLPEAND